MTEEEIERAVEQFYKRREVRLRARLEKTTDLLEKYHLLKAIHHNRKKLIDKWLKTDTIKSKDITKDGGPGSGNHGHKGVPGQIGGSAPAGPKEDLAEAIKTGRVKTKLDKKKQSKHTKGSRAYQKAIDAGKYVSVITISDAEVQKLVDQYSGKGHIHIINGQIKETFEHTEVIGMYVSRTGESAETKRGTIHYSKDGSHIVPSVPKGSGKA